MNSALAQSPLQLPAPALAQHLRLHDFEPAPDGLREAVRHGLAQPQKSLPCKFFYDERGAQLFDRICELDEYYPTRTEMAIMRQHGPAMAAMLGRDCLLIEYGSGSSLKTRLLLDHLHDHLHAPAGYVPIDISKAHLMRAAAALAASYPGLPVFPVCADYTARFELPVCRRPMARHVVYFPGSTIGNFEPAAAQRFLRHIAAVCGPGGGLLIGVDLRKDPAIIEPAYNDRKGVTAAFNLNLLERINRELDADFALQQFHHRAFFNPEHSRIEMHLVSQRAQPVQLDGAAFHFEAGESILTEYSYKYSLARFARLAAAAGFQVQKVWLDERRWFSVQYLTVA